MKQREAAPYIRSGFKFTEKDGLPKPRAHSKFNANIEESVNPQELEHFERKK